MFWWYSFTTRCNRAAAGPAGSHSKVETNRTCDMKRFFILFIVLLLGSIASAQNHVREDSLVLIETDTLLLAYLKGETSPYTGKAIRYSHTGDVEMTMFYFHGKLEGQCIEYFENGKVKIKKNFLKGKLEGEYFEYYENGNQKIWAEYSNDKLHNNFYVEFRKDGTQLLSGGYNLGKKDGVWAHLDENEKCYKTEVWEDGILKRVTDPRVDKPIIRDW